MDSMRSIVTIVDDDDDFGQGEQLTREPQRVAEYVEEVISSESTQAILKLVPLTERDKNRTQMRSLGLIPVLISIISSVKPPKLNEKQAAALKLFAGVCKNLPNREEVRNKGGIDPLLKLVDLQSDEDLALVFEAIYLLADNPKNRIALNKAGVIEATVPKMKKVNPATLQSILKLLSVMALNDKKVQDVVVKAGGVTVIIDSILQNDPATRLAAVNALGSVCSGNRQAQALARRSKPALAAIVNMLRDPVVENRELAASVITHIAENDFTNQTALEKEGVLNAFQIVLSNPNEAYSVKEKVCEALAAMSNGNSKVQKAWNDYSTLIACVCTPSVGCQVQALIAISELCSNNSPNCESFIQSGIIPLLVSALQSDQEPVQYRATNAVYAIIRNNPTRREIFKQDGNMVPTLNALKGSGNPKVKQGAEWALEEMK